MMDLTQYFVEGKAAIDLLKAAWGLLPKGDNADKAKAEIDKAEASLIASQAQIAQAMGFRICRCKYPPEIMLWDKDKRVSVCPACGDVYPHRPKIEPLKSGFRS